MDNKDGSLPILKKMILASVAGFIVLFVVQMSRMPPEGQWVTDAGTPVLPSLRYKNINEPWAKAYLADDKLATSEPSQSLPKPAQQTDIPHSYFSSPRFISARNSYNYYKTTDSNSGSASAETYQPKAQVVADDLLRPGIMNDSKHQYSADFGAAINNANN